MRSQPDSRRDCPTQIVPWLRKRAVPYSETAVAELGGLTGLLVDSPVPRENRTTLPLGRFSVALLSGRQRYDISFPRTGKRLVLPFALLIPQLGDDLFLSLFCHVQFSNSCSYKLRHLLCSPKDQRKDNPFADEAAILRREEKTLGEANDAPVPRGADIPIQSAERITKPCSNQQAKNFKQHEHQYQLQHKRSCRREPL
jgi:hypothetical protein